MRLRGRDDGGSAIEAALLIAAMTLVLVPILYALGKTTTSALKDPCDTLAEKVGLQSCENAGSGDGGGGGGAGGGGSGNDSPSSIEVDVTSYWASQPGAPPATDVTCDPFAESPPPAGATTDCTVMTPDGPATVRVTVDEGGGFRYDNV